MSRPTEPLAEPVSIPFTAAVRDRFRAAGISTAWSIDEFDQGRGWLADIPAYAFRRRIRIEGPCAFYGGPYGANPWTADGGLCTMGAASYSHSPLPEGLVVGRYCSIGKGLRFLDFAHPTQWLSSSVAFFRPEPLVSPSCLAALLDRAGRAAAPDFARQGFDPRQGQPDPVIGHDVWIGENVTLALGIRIGTGAVIAAGSIVTRNVPPYAMVAGVPAEVRKYRFAPELIEALLEAAWWDYHFADLAAFDVRQPNTLLEGLRSAAALGTIQAWRPVTLTLPDDLLEADT